MEQWKTQATRPRFSIQHWSFLSTLGTPPSRTCYLFPLTGLPSLFSPLWLNAHTGPTVFLINKRERRAHSLGKSCWCTVRLWRSSARVMGVLHSSANAAQSPGKWMFLSPFSNTKTKAQEVTSLFIVNTGHSEHSQQALWLLNSYHTPHIPSALSPCVEG